MTNPDPHLLWHRLGLRAWDEQQGCECGAGMPCECVRARLEQPDIAEVIPAIGRRLRFL